MSFLGQENGYLVRRLSGGGAVFRNLGNLNFTSIMDADDYDVSRQLGVILETVKSLGIHAKKTGRNDIMVDGRRFLDNAFYRTGDGYYHHGTMLVRADKENMSRYLSISKEKLASKGMTSVKSRMANLCESKPDITLEETKSALVEAFSKVYGRPVARMEEGELSQPDIDTRIEKFVSWQWKYGRKTPFECEVERRFPWGDIQVQSHVDEGITQGVNIFSGAMDQEMIRMLAEQLKDCAYVEEDIYRMVKAMGTDAFQAKEHTGASESQSYRIKKDIMTPVRGSL